MRRELLANQVANLEEGMRYHHYETTSLKLSQPTASHQNSSAAERWARKLNETNLLTTASKFIPT